MTAGAVRETAKIVRERIVAIAAHKLEAAPEDIELADSRATVRGTPTVGISLAEIAAMAYFDPASLPPGMTAGLEASARYTADDTRRSGSTPPTSAPARSTSATGEVTLLRYIVSEDCGPMINPNVVEGQIAGGTVQGIGGVLYEHLVLRRGRQPDRHDVHGLPAADRGRGSRDRVRPHRDAQPPAPAATRASARAAPSARRRRSSTRSPTRCRRSASRSPAAAEPVSHHRAHRRARAAPHRCLACGNLSPRDRREAAVSEPAPPRRPYDSPVRRQRAAETRARIVAAGAEILHG